MDSSTQNLSPLRLRMIEDMRMRKLASKTQAAYIRSVRQFTRYLRRSLDSATVEDLRNYQLHLVDRGVSGDLAERRDNGAEVLLRDHPRPA